MSVSLSEPQGPFARTCQASILVSRVESHVRETISRHRAHSPEPFSIVEVNTLIDDITTFSSIISSELSLAANTPEPNTNFNSPYTTPAAASPFILSQASTANHNQPSHSSASPSSNPPTSHTPVPSLLTPRFLLFSAQILLFDLHCCPEDILSSGPGNSTAVPKSQASLNMQVRAVNGIREASRLSPRP